MFAVAAVLGGIAVLSAGCGDKGAEVSAKDAAEEVAEVAEEGSGDGLCSLDGECGEELLDDLDALVEVAEEAEPDLPPETVLAKIGDARLTVAEADAELLKMFGGQADLAQVRPILARMRPQVVGNFVVKTLVEQEIARQGIEVSEEEIDAEIAKVMERNPLPEGMTLEQVLAQQNVPMEEFRQNMGMMAKVNKLVPEPTEEAMAEFYAANAEEFAEAPNVSARHILVATSEEDTDEQKAEKKAKIEAIRQQLLDGADFAGLAKENSDCPSGQRGGDLGSFGRGQMVPEFDEAAFSQEVDAIGEVVETQFGFHVLQVTERSEGGTIPFEEAKDDIAGELRGEAFRTLVDTLRASAAVEYHESVAGIFRDGQEEEGEAVPDVE
jgi:peptidyl-prolyl cis-trans isomerase C